MMIPLVRGCPLSCVDTYLTSSCLLLLFMGKNKEAPWKTVPKRAFKASRDNPAKLEKEAGTKSAQASLNRTKDKAVADEDSLVEEVELSVAPTVAVLSDIELAQLREKQAALARIDSHAANKRAKKTSILLQDNKQTSVNNAKSRAKPCKHGRECTSATCRFSHPSIRCPRGSTCTRGASCLLYHHHLDESAKRTIVEREEEEALRHVLDEGEEEGGGGAGEGGLTTAQAVAAAKLRKEQKKTVYRDLSLRQQSLTKSLSNASLPDIRTLAESFGQVKRLSEPRGLYQLCRLTNKVKYICTHTGKPYLSSILAFHIASGKVVSNAAFSQLAPPKKTTAASGSSSVDAPADPRGTGDADGKRGRNAADKKPGSKRVGKKHAARLAAATAKARAGRAYKTAG